MPLYTVGQRANYEKAIIANAPKPVLKMGRTEDYCGGIVFRHITSAVAWRIAWRHDDYAVWQLDTNESNVYEGDDGELYLINDAPIISPAVY